MKFAALALIGAVSASEETELVGKRWNWRAVGPLMKQEERVMETFADIADDIDWEKMEKKMQKKMKYIQKRYGPEMMQWLDSPAVKAKIAHNEKVMESDLGQEFLRSLEQVGQDAKTVHWAAGFDQDGYGEWIKNEDLAMMFEDLYAVKEALKALVTSKMAVVNGKLGEK